MKKKKRIVYNLCLAVLICIFLGSAGYLAYYFLQSKKSEDQFQELEAMIDAPVNEEEIVYVATDGDAEPAPQTLYKKIYVQEKSLKHNTL